jgi:hypothetical protein
MLQTTVGWRRPGVAAAIALVSSLMVHAGGSAAAEAPNGLKTVESVRAAETARAQALMHADTTALSRMTAAEFVEISRLGQLRTKADNLGDLASGALKLTSVKYDSVSVRIYGDVAVLRGIADNIGTFRGFPFSGKIWYSRIFVLRDGRWQAVAMQHTPIP